MSCLIAQSLEERYRTAAVEWARCRNLPKEVARLEAEHDKALLDSAKHKQACPECLSDEWVQQICLQENSIVEESLIEPGECRCAISALLLRRTLNGCGFFVFWRG
jgi:hypothetical protein